MNNVIIGLSCALLLSTVPVFAASTVNGPTGLINSPTADVLRSGQFTIGYYHLGDGDVGSFTTNVVPNVELGVTEFHYDGQGNKNYINVKYALKPETILKPGLAIGIEDISNKDKQSIYAVTSKALPFAFRLHAGVGSGRFNGLFAGIEKTINPIRIRSNHNTFPPMTLIAEYDGKTMNYGARMSIMTGLKLDAGIRNHNGYIGISFTN